MLRHHYRLCCWLQMKSSTKILIFLNLKQRFERTHVWKYFSNSEKLSNTGSNFPCLLLGREKVLQVLNKTGNIPPFAWVHLSKTTWQAREINSCKKWRERKVAGKSFPAVKFEEILWCESDTLPTWFMHMRIQLIKQTSPPHVCFYAWLKLDSRCNE